MAESIQQTKQTLTQLDSLQPGQLNDGLGGVFHRLRSFSPTTWFGKPPQLSALECALKGWQNSGPDQLTCPCCGSQILCKLPLNPVAESSAGIVAKFAQRLIEAHAAHCPFHRQLDQQQQPHAAGLPAAASAASDALRFPRVSSSKLASSFNRRLQKLHRLDAIPPVEASVRAQLATAAGSLDSSILAGLAAVLHTSAQALKREAAAAAVQGMITLSATAAGPIAMQDNQQQPQQQQPQQQQQQAVSSTLPKDQALVLLALCGWQPKLLQLPGLSPASEAARPSSALGVSHLVPSKRRSSSSQAAAAAPTAAAVTVGSSINNSRISCAHAALDCELCGSQVGLWRFSCSGPLYAQQLASKAMEVLATATATEQEAHPPSPAAVAPGSISPVPAAAGASVDKAEAAAVAQQVLASSIAGGPLHGTASDAQQQQPLLDGATIKAPVLPAAAAASASPKVVMSTLCHTIAGGSLASGGRRRSTSAQIGPTAAALTSPQASGPFGQQQQQQQLFGLPAAPVFGSPAVAPVFDSAATGSLGGSSAGKAAVQGEQQQQELAASGATAAAAVAGDDGDGDGQLFAELQASSTASVFGSPPPPRVGPLGPFGAQAGVNSFGASGSSSQTPSAAAPVFGLGALTHEEQRVKRRRSGSATAADVSAAATAAITAAHAATDLVLRRAASQPAPDAAAAAPAGTSASSIAAAAGGGSGSSRARSLLREQSALAVAAAAEVGNASAAPPGVIVCFDPIAAHRSWCPWVHQHMAAAGSSSSSGLLQALRLGWCSTVMAVQEVMEEQQLQAGGSLEQQQQQHQNGDGQLPQPGQFDSTAAVLAKARQLMDALD